MNNNVVWTNFLNFTFMAKQFANPPIDSWSLHVARSRLVFKWSSHANYEYRLFPWQPPTLFCIFCLSLSLVIILISGMPHLIYIYIYSCSEYILLQNVTYRSIIIVDYYLYCYSIPKYYVYKYLANCHADNLVADHYCPPSFRSHRETLDSCRIQPVAGGWLLIDYWFFTNHCWTIKINLCLASFSEWMWFGIVRHRWRMPKFTIWAR